MSRRAASRPVAGPVAWALLLWGSAAPAHAFDAATTHAGLTERALEASTVKRRLGALFAWGARRPRGLYETLTLGDNDEPSRALRDRVGRLDPAAGIRPEGGRLTALGWLVAGSVVEEVPPTRAQNHFLDPQSGRGLDASGAGTLSLRLALPDGFTGAGASSVAWLAAADNDLSLVRFLDARERALTASDPAARDAAAAVALLAAGALLHVVEDAAEPAYTHNDLHADLYGQQAPFSRYVAQRYGRLALPEPRGPAQPLAHLADAIHNADHTGLADRTAVRFFSVGALALRTGGDGAGATAPPSLPQLEPGPAAEGWIEDAAHRRLAHYRRVNDGVRWDLDARCYQDAAAVLLPEAAQAALSALEHLFRGGLVVEGGAVKNGDVPLGAGRLRVLVEDETGGRKELTAIDVPQAEAGATLGTLPPEASGRRVVVAFRGVDSIGEPLVVAGEAGTATPPAAR